MAPELTTSQYLDAMDLLEANKDRILVWDLEFRRSAIRQASSVRTLEATLEVLVLRDTERLRRLRAKVTEDIAELDKKHHGIKYWRVMAANVGLEWIAN